MFRTELPIAPATSQLPRTARVLTVGSCFADSIGLRLAANKVESLVNPFGTVFQPLALTKLLRAAAGEDVDWQQHLVEARGRWQSYDLHGSIGADSPVELLLIIQELVRRTGEFLRQADLMLLTLGTAWAYRLRETGELVSNCHKQSADLFVRELLTPDEIINNLAETHAYLRRINPELHFILTVSPVRHLRDTLPLNSVSKSVLRLATHIVSDLLPGVAYFPAYELLLDDLRDYRFYASDMLHPSEVAEDYIWEKFARTYFDADFGRFRKEWAAVRQSLGHRPLHAGAPEHRQFLESTREKLEQLHLREVEVAAELNEVRMQLAALPVPRQPEPVTIPEDDEERIDIGEGNSITATAEVATQPAVSSPNSTEGRPPRLSPEEFRAQRAARSGRPERDRRDGRGKGQRDIASENEIFQTAAASVEEQPEILNAVNLTETTSGTDSERAEQLAAASTKLIVNDLSDAEGEDSVKKKKRRSRGGAKRTARKNALRLAAGELLPETDTSSLSEAVEVTSSTPENENDVAAPETPNSSVIAKSVPVKRGGRRNQPGRISRVELFAAPTEGPDTENLQLPVDTELPLVTASMPLTAAVVLSSIPVAVVAAVANPRNNRNRNNQSAAKIEAGNVPTKLVPATSVVKEAVETAAINREAPVAEPTESTRATVPTTPVSSSKSNRAKRMVSAARSEKPAIDVPVIPIQDVQLRTQVAAGRMTGNFASLVAPTAPSFPAKKASTAKKPVAVKKAAVPTSPVAEVEPTATPAVVVSLTLVPASVIKPKQTAKPKVATLKAVAAKAMITKAVVVKPAVVAKRKITPATAVVSPAPKATTTTVAAKSAVKPKAKTSPAKPLIKKVVTPEPVPAKKVATKPSQSAAKSAATKLTVPKAKVPKKPTKPA